MTSVARAVFPIPPFPGAKALEHIQTGRPTADPTAPALLLDAMRRLKVGGNFWNAGDVTGAGDVWSSLGHAHIHTADDPVGLLLAIAGQKVHLQGSGAFEQLSDRSPEEAKNILLELIECHLLKGIIYFSPFSGEEISALELVTILGDWRRLIDSNRPIKAAFGFAHWKRDTVDPLLWGGRTVPFLAPTPDALKNMDRDATIAVWKARVPAPFLAALETGPWRLMEVEDGFIRSAGLGADCIPPLSIVADDLGVHYDPAQPNRLEEMLACHDFAAEDLARARRLRKWIVERGISKYGIGNTTPTPRNGGVKKHLLVVGQVEDDRSVLFGGGAISSNLALLKRVRDAAPDAWIVYRPHPDVEAGHRRGRIAKSIVRQYSDEVEPSSPISALIAMVDEVHVITSLAGFEALLHEKSVTTHGTPFYSGWGLTHDLGQTTPRRGRARSIDELVAAVLLLYPRYVDPVTNLPCPAEIMIMRLISGVQRQNFALVPMRRFVGWARRASAHILGLR